jgi:hypothetical protein
MSQPLLSVSISQNLRILSKEFEVILLFGIRKEGGGGWKPVTRFRVKL